MKDLHKKEIKNDTSSLCIIKIITYDDNNTKETKNLDGTTEYESNSNSSKNIDENTVFNIPRQ